jgi:hypothetical protein
MPGPQKYHSFFLRMWTNYYFNSEIYLQLHVSVFGWTAERLVSCTGLIFNNIFIIFVTKYILRFV